MFKKENGITLIALIITIIVMLVLVGVTINVALNGGLFEKAEKAAYQTNVVTIQEKLAMKKAEILAENGGKSQEDYKITFDMLELTGNLEEFKTKLAISKDGTLHYIAEEVNDREKAWLTELGITEGGTDSDDSIVGVYGNKQYTAIEMLEGGVGYSWYENSKQGEFIYDEDTLSIQVGSNISKFEHHIIKDSNNRTVNKAIVAIGDSREMTVYTTNGGVGGTTLDGNTYISADGDTISFENGQINISLDDSTYKYIYYMGHFFIGEFDGVYYITGNITIDEDTNTVTMEHYESTGSGSSTTTITFNLVTE